MTSVVKQRLRRYYGASYDPNAPVDIFNNEDVTTGTIDPRELWPLNRTVLFDNRLLVQNQPYN